MKTKILLFALSLLCCFATKAQAPAPIVHDNPLPQVFENLEKSRIPHGLLLDAAVEFANLKKYNGTLPDSSYVSSQVVVDIYKTLQFSRLSTAASFSKTVDEFITDWKMAQQIELKLM